MHPENLEVDVKKLSKKAANRKWRKENPHKVAAAYNKAWRKKNMPTVNTAREIALTPEQIKKRAEYAKTYVRPNPEKKKESDAAWAKANIAKKTMASSRRRAAKLLRTPKWAINDPRITEVYRQAQIWDMEVDHVLPLQGEYVSGFDCWENLQLLHRSINRAKSNHYLPE